MKSTDSLLRYVLLGGIFLVPFIPFIVSNSMFFPFITGKNFAFRILVEILFGGWLVLIFNNSQYRPRFTKLTIAVLSLLAVVTLATIFSENPYRSFWSNYERMDGLVSLLHLGAYFLVISSILTTEKLWRRFFQTSLGASAVMGLYALGQAIGWAQINQGIVRADGRFGNATYLAVYALFHIFFALYFIVTTKDNWLKWVYSLVALANFSALFLTATRGTMLGLLGGILLFGILLAWLGQGKTKKLAIGAIGLVAILILAFLSVRHTDFVKQNPTLSRFAAISLNDQTTQARFLIWQMSAKGFIEHPLIGWGPENYNLVFDKYYNPELFRQEQWFDRSHNVFFDWLINAGVLGLAAYLALFILALGYVWRSKEEVVVKSLITGLLAGYFFHNIFVFDNLISYIFFFSVLAWINSLHLGGEITTKKDRLVTQTLEVDSLRYVFAGVVVFATVGLVYFVNLKPIQASQELIRGLTPSQNLNTNLGHFKKVFALNTFGSGETREHLLNTVLVITGQPNIPAEVKQGWVVFAGGAMEEAIKSGRQNDARSNSFFSNFSARLGAYDQAIVYSEAARKFSPTKPVIIIQEGEIYLARNGVGDKDQALKLAKQAFDLAPNYPIARKNYIFIAVKVGREDLAADLIAESDNPDVLFNPQLINFYAERKQYDKILTIWKKLTVLAPTNVDYRGGLVAIYLQLNRPADALKELRLMLTLKPNDQMRQAVEFYIKELEAGRTPPVQ